MITRYYGETTRKEKKKPDHEFSSTQVNLPEWIAKKVRGIGDKIPSSELTEDGRESDIHITVKFGLHDSVPSEKLKKALKGFGRIQAKLGETSLFSNDDADVVKVDVDSPSLHRLNKLISKTVEVTDTHPTYKPHVTIAYVKPGNGKKYSGNTALSGLSVGFDSLVFSSKDRSRKEISLV